MFNDKYYYLIILPYVDFFFLFIIYHLRYLVVTVWPTESCELPVLFLFFPFFFAITLAVFSRLHRVSPFSGIFVLKNITVEKNRYRERFLLGSIRLGSNHAGWFILHIELSPRVLTEPRFTSA